MIITRLCRCAGVSLKLNYDKLVGTEAPVPAVIPSFWLFTPSMDGYFILYLQLLDIINQLKSTFKQITRYL
ncbi:hypothetical protein [Desulfosporosinus sp.]|uniref:hypothetical protein n=1 Tax=Desulfosporosinus sp. TaxID=157907 RepID=UPI0025C0FFF2|nr:hypothetical protein [Desulfosporosinus sp.]MBC2721141.1 hypothetical protein [Desulfosporosinus sp.]MBC2728263.1 hypothetical protein [Desulfosporosinus sp.]